jgi:ribosomal protein S18 acetylase RimI-like enzyme
MNIRYMIRVYTRHDWAEVKRIFLENVPKFFGLEELGDLADYLLLHHETYFVLIKDDCIVGAGGYHFPGIKKARLSWNFVSPSCQGLGIGKTLIQHCMNEIQKHNPEEMEVWTSQLAFKFYERFGFKTIETKDDFWVKGLHLHKMTLAIQ